MLNFLKRNYFSIAITTAFITLVIMIFSHSRLSYDYVFGKFFQNITIPITQVSQNLADKIRFTIDQYVALTEVKKQNDQLINELNLLKTKKAELSEKLADYEKLQKALGYTADEGYSKIYAKVIHYIDNDYSKLAVINRGSDSGIKKNQGVISYSNLVGKVIRVSEKYAIVQLLTDPQFKLPVLLQKTRSRGLIVGTGSETLLLKALSREEVLETGDKIITSNVINIFPIGLEVGEIVSAQTREFNWIQEAKIKPAIDLKKIEDVFVIKSNASDEIIKLVESLDLDLLEDSTQEK